MVAVGHSITVNDSDIHLGSHTLNSRTHVLVVSKLSI